MTLNPSPPRPYPTCKHRDWTGEDNDTDAPFPSGPECGEQATFLACVPSMDTPVCCKHTCRCRKPIKAEEAVGALPQGTKDYLSGFREGYDDGFQAGLARPCACEQYGELIVLQKVAETARALYITMPWGDRTENEREAFAAALEAWERIKKLGQQSKAAAV